MRRSASLRLAVAAVALGLIGACGARVPGAVRQHAADSILRSGGSGQVAGGQPGQSAPPGSVPGAAGRPGSSANPATGGTRPVPGQRQVGGGGNGSGRSAGGHGSTGTTAPQCSGGTDVGLTASAMTLGTVATLTGPVSGLFEGAVQGIVSFANYLNTDNGGLCGRHVTINAADDGTNCSQNENVTQSLIAKTFALVGSFSLYDGCGATIIRQHPTVSDVHLALDPAAETPPNHFDISAGESGYATGMFHYYAQKYGSKVKHVGTIVENIPSAISNQENQVNAAQSQGWHFVMSIKESPTTSNFTQDFQKLCGQAHMQVFFLLTEPAQNAATMMRNERQAGCHGVINVVPIAYDQAFIADYGSPVSDLDGIQGWSEYALFFNSDEAANIPEVKLLQQWFQRSYPGKPLNLYAMYSWADGRLFQEAAEHAGGTLTRQAVLRSLRKVKQFSANGLISPRSPVQRAGVHCYILWQLHNGVFSRLADPMTGYRCDGHFLPR